MEHFFTTYIRTKCMFKNRLKDLHDYDTVKIYVFELKKLNVNGPLLYRLKERGEITYDDKGNFKALKDGPIIPSILERGRKKVIPQAPLTPLHLWMRGQLMFVELDIPKKEMPVYFGTFLQLRGGHLDSFFTVDGFSNRVHTPVVNLKHDLRLKLRFHGSRIVSLDVKQMQPMVLAKVLDGAIGDNVFSDSIFHGNDVYVLLQESASLDSRAEAKKMLFRLIFGKPMDDIGTMFKGDTDWVKWINKYKSNTEPRNPHKEHKHTNLAWLLQFSEVQVMACVWDALKDAGVPFLTIHDDVLCREEDEHRAHTIMKEVLKHHFKRFSINITRPQ